MMSRSNQKRWPSVLTVLGVIGALTLVADNGIGPVASAQQDLLVYVPVASPCRVVRTQGTAQTHLNNGASRNFFSFGAAGTIGAQGGNAAGCDHPRSGAGIQPVAIAANVTAVGKQATGNGNISAYPAGGAVPSASTVNYTTAANIANSTLITLCTTGCPVDGDFTLLSSFSNVPAIVDVVGYYYPMGAAQQVTVNCPAESIQAAIDAAAPDGHLSITINGTCNENVLIRRDDVTLRNGTDGVIVGQAGAEFESAIEIESARNVLIDSLSVSGGALGGILGIDAAVFFVESSVVDSNALHGIVVDLGSSAVIESSTITNNGTGSPPINVGVGIAVLQGASAEIDGNTIEDNNADGIDVVDGAFASLTNNSIKRNGRAGVSVSRAVVARALGNTYLDNAAVALEVWNAGTYRTGSWLTAGGRLDNEGPFESISAGTGQLAVDIGRQSYAGLRQVLISGRSKVGHMSMMLVRGDKVGPSQTCSTMNNGAGNAVDLYGANAVIQFDYVAVTGTVTGSGTVIGSTICP